MRLTSMCPVVWINITVATGLQTTHMNFTSVLCIVHKWHCGVKFILMALLVLISLRMWRGYTNCACTAVHSHTWNISLQWFTSYLARFVVVPTRWSNSSHSRNFHASFRDNVSGQSHFLFWGHQLACLLTWPCSTRLLPQGSWFKQGIRNMSCQYCRLKTANSGVYSRDPQGNVTCYEAFSIVTAVVYWMAWY